MDSMKVLEEKVVQLVGVVKSLKTENGKLKKEIDGLCKEKDDMASKLEAMEMSLLKQDESVQVERALTKEVVEDLIKSIDSLVG